MAINVPTGIELGTLDRVSSAEMTVSLYAERYVAALDTGDHEAAELQLSILRDCIRYLREARAAFEVRCRAVLRSDDSDQVGGAS